MKGQFESTSNERTNTAGWRRSPAAARDGERRAEYLANCTTNNTHCGRTDERSPPEYFSSVYNRDEHSEPSSSTQLVESDCQSLRAFRGGITAVSLCALVECLLVVFLLLLQFSHLHCYWSDKLLPAAVLLSCRRDSIPVAGFGGK